MRAVISLHHHASACLPGDVLICDPPFSPHVHESAVSNNPGGVETGTHKRDLGFEPLSPALLGVLVGLMQATPRWSCVFTDIESVGAVWQPQAPKQYVRSVPWVRWSQPQKSGDRPGSGSEMVSIFHPGGRKRWNGPGGLTHFWAKCLRGPDKHPTEKPLDLMLALVSFFSDPGERVVDPVMGSGTTGVAALLLGRTFTGAEKHDGHFNRARGRLSACLDGEISDADFDRAKRWVEDMIALWENEATSTPKALERRDRSLADIEHVAERLGL